jgi:two-component system KDP operon response regulator KdpE
VVDDDERILNFLRAKLKASNYDVLTASSGREGLEQVKCQEPDLVILDVLMPGMNGLEMLRELRSFSIMPVIILTAKGEDTDRIQGLRLGADDYLPKPFNPDELLARIEAIGRRISSGGRQESPEVFALDGVVIDFKKRSVSVRGEYSYLTRIEWLLLSELVHYAGRLLLYGELLTSVWGAEYRDDTQLLRTWISRLRYKLEEDPKHPRLIRTITKAGYIMDQPSS